MSDLIGAALERKRGDTAPDKVRVDFAGGIAGFSYKMTVNTLKAPPDNTTQRMQSIGVVTSDLLGGDVIFPWVPGDADQVPGKYYYDIQQTDTAGKIKTIAKNVYVFFQDITKN